MSSMSSATLLYCFCGALLVLMLVKCMLGQRRGVVSVPCLPYLPVVGSLLHLRSSLPPHLLFTQLAGRYGSLFGLYMGPHYTLVVSEVSLVREVLLQRGREFAGRPKMVTTDLLTQGGKDIAFADYSLLWKNHRRLVQSSFTLLVFNSSYQPNDPELLKVLDYNDGIVQTIVRGGLVDIFPWLKVTLTPGEPRDLLDALLIGKMKGSGGDDDITDDHVLMTAAEAFGAGVETTSTTLLWAIAFLLHHPQVQERVQAELDEVLGRDRPPALSDRSSLPFLESVICEVMRIRPVSPILIPHVAMQDTSLGGHSVPKGTRVLVNMWAIHHDPKHWEEADTFRPERFLDSSGKRVTPASFLPFGAGPRVCVGESLARLELFLFVSRLLQKFNFSVPSGRSLPDLQGRYGVVLQPHHYTVRVTPRY
ncbi:Steroid 17-alpha-hydroxylase/17,20 lyase [Triplophysa tibetana]|uniref:Steroid 17-alpha-hydroxylase/17,20 lyase n=1 Tax=Triplophysa tibetana TaxID=1572043 RepID=A0A5A9NB96_9TELE|nr:Steroid 17-alpha-hydroxylase/17,20 lyase [Triplophysa tibetana]